MAASHSASGRAVSQISESPSTTRQRQACERCFKRKQKCDKLSPECSQCAELGANCVPRGWAFDGAVVRDAGVTNASIAEYVAALQRRIDNRNDAGHTRPRKRRRVDSRATDPTRDTNCPRPELQRTNTVFQNDPSRSSDEARREIDTSVRNTIGQFGLLLRSAMAEPRGHEDKFSRSLTLKSMLSAALNLTGGDPTKASAMSSIRPKLVTASNEPVELDRDSALPYLSLFVEQIGIQFPYLHDAVLMKQYEAVTQVIADDDNSRDAADTAFARFHTYLAIALGILHSPDYIALSTFVIRLHSAAIEQLPLILNINNNFGLVRCMLTLTIFSTFHARGGSAWHLSGLTMAKCISLGLHKEPDPTEFDDDEACERRELFWSAYMLDRSISAVLGRPFAIQEDDITVRMPNSRDDPGCPKVTAYKCHLVPQARLASNIQTGGRDNFSSTYHDVCFWREPSLALISLSQKYPQVANHLEQLSCRMLIQMVQPGPAPNAHRESNMNDNREIEVDAALSCRRFINECYQCYEDGHTGLSFLFGHDIFCASVTFVCLAWRVTLSSELRVAQSEIIQKCTTLLTLLGQQFSALKAFQRALLEISNRFMSSEGNSVPVPTNRSWESLQHIIPEHIVQLIKHSL